MRRREWLPFACKIRQLMMLLAWMRPEQRIIRSRHRLTELAMERSMTELATIIQ